MTPILQASNISKKFSPPNPITLFDNLSLNVYPQRTIAIMGASGEGKTTLLHMLGGIANLSSGRILFHGTPLKQPSPDKIGMIFQAYNLLEDFSLLDNVLMPARISRFPLNQFYNRAIHLLQTMGLDDKKERAAKLLSGGEKQRVAIARALLCNPDLLLADEPSGNLDHHNSAIIHKLLIEHVTKEKKALIVATHDKELASLCEEIYLLEDKSLCKMPAESGSEKKIDPFPSSVLS